MTNTALLTGIRLCE